MKLLILTCLVAAAMAMPKFPFRYTEISQSQQDSRSSSSEETLKDQMFRFVQPTSVNVRKQKQLLRGKQSEEIEEASNESTEERMTNFEEVDSCNSEKCITRKDMLYQMNLEQLYRLIKYIQLQQEQLNRINEHNPALVREPMRLESQEQAPFFYEPYAYPFAGQLFPQQVHYVPYLPFYSPKPIASENIQKTDFMSAWLI